MFIHASIMQWKEGEAVCLSAAFLLLVILLLCSSFLHSFFFLLLCVRLLWKYHTTHTSGLILVLRSYKNCSFFASFFHQVFVFWNSPQHHWCCCVDLSQQSAFFHHWHKISHMLSDLFCDGDDEYLEDSNDNALMSQRYANSYFVLLTSSIMHHLMMFFIQSEAAAKATSPSCV